MDKIYPIDSDREIGLALKSPSTTWRNEGDQQVGLALRMGTVTDVLTKHALANRMSGFAGGEILITNRYVLIKQQRLEKLDEMLNEQITEWLQDNGGVRLRSQIDSNHLGQRRVNEEAGLNRVRREIPKLTNS